MLNHITLYIRWLPNIFINYASAAACEKRLNALFDHVDIADELLEPSGQMIEGAQPVSIRFCDVSFKYRQETVISHLTLTIDLREHTSLIGAVGSGKSTLLKLICAEIKPTDGVILVEFDSGVITNLWHQDVYAQVRKELAYMPQEAYLSNTSLAINVSLDDGFGNGSVMEAIRMAELEADIARWEHGTEEEIGEIGVNLSGGQKQRVNLARALYSGRHFLVLDDPLSAVDTETEDALMGSLLSGSRGFLLSSHRLTELHRTGRLLVMDKGEIVEDGRPRDLLADRGSEFSKHLYAGDLNYAQ
jgi:ATP-binding cassette subfamily B multidrug efflux pump